MLSNTISVFTSNIESVPVIKTGNIDNNTLNVNNKDSYEFIVYSHTKNIDSNESVTYSLYKDGNDYSNYIASYSNNKVAENNVNAKEIRFSLLKNKAFLIQLFATNVIMATCNSASNYSIQVILEKLGCPTSLISTVPFIMIVMEILLLFIFHKLPFAKKSYLATFTALIILCFRWYFMAIIPNYMFLLFLMIVHGVVVGIIMPVQNNLIADLVPTNQQSTAFLFEVVVVPTILSSILNLFTGYLSSYTGISIFGYTYLALSIVALIMIIPSFLRESRRKKKVC